MNKGIKACSTSISLKSAPLVMGIVNVTPDSFTDGGRYLDRDNAIKHALTLIENEADIIDIGGESTRPGSDFISESEEMERVIPVIREISKLTDIPISIDTTKHKVAEAALKNGASIINDISGLTFDPAMIKVASESGAGVIIMHILGKPKSMQVNIHYDSLLEDIFSFLSAQAEKLLKSGSAKESIIIDPGIGFGKTVEHNLEIIKNISFLKKLGYPILVGASRKSFIGKTLDLEVDERIEGTLVVDTFNTLNGVDIIRSHDVKRTLRAIKMTAALISAPGKA